MRKVLGSLSLLVLLFNTLLTPLTYAEEYEEIIETSSENTAEEVVEETGEEESSSEFSVEEENTEEENVENSKETEGEEGEEMENTTRDNEGDGTGEISEIGNGEIEGLTGKTVEGETGDIVEVLTGTTEELTGDVGESSGTGEETIVEEIKYNEEPIIGEETYDNVTVKVEALSGTFPEGTELVIEPIRYWNLVSLKRELVEERNEIGDDTTLVAFDITFRYEGEEVQPKEGEKVKVIFDYTKNEELVEADKDNSQEIKVYHIEDKDEEGNKVEDEEKKIRDVTNVEESEEDGIAVADGKSFSVYAVVTVAGTPETVQVTYDLNGGYWTENGNTEPELVTYTRGNSGDYIADKYFMTPSNTGFMFMGWFDQSGTIRWTGNLSEGISVYAKWQEFEDLDVYIIDGSQSAHYTMMDRNLGATERFNQKYDKQNFGSFGYHFQWGNNYGFKLCNGNNCTSFDEGENISSGKLDNTIRLNVSPSKFYYGVWNNNADMRWSGNNVSNLWGSETNTLESRQGPCPEGYHIPNDNEWEQVVNKSKNIGISVVNISVALLLSQPGYRNVNGKWINFPHTFWSSDASYSMDNKKIKTSFMLFESGQVGFKKDQGVDSSRSIRCFKNVVTNSFDLSHIDEDGGLRGEISISSGTVLYLKNPVKQGYIFDGWYKNSGFLGEKIELGSYISSTDYIYAKWSTCPSGFVADDESINCLPESTAYADDQKISQIVEDLEVFMINDNNETFHYTLMDRNMGAKERYDGNIENQNSYGYVYQWGNNYGFPSTGSLVNHGIASYNFQVPYSDWIIYSPSNFSKNVWNTFNSNNGKGVGWIDDGDLDSSKSLWQGDGTAESRQGPCPDGYYVPYKGIFQSFFDQWKSSDSNITYGSFASNFLFPTVGYRDIGGKLYVGIGKYWTSTPHNSKGTANIFYLNTLSFEGEQNYDFGYSVRCFKKEANTGANIFDVSHIELNSGSKVVLSLLSGGEIAALSSPYRQGHNFEGWYKNSEFEGQEVRVGDTLLSSDYLFAKWGDCPEGTAKDPNGECQVVQDLDVYFISSTGTKNHYTLMDRNMGATYRYNQKYDSNSNFESYGYYYQWGNNYGFDSRLKNSGKISNSVNIYVNNKYSYVVHDLWDYSWNNPYFSGTYIKNSVDKTKKTNTNWMETINPNLWGGEESIISRKQGPCPVGYHVPSSDEWRNIYAEWGDANSVTNNDTAKRKRFAFDLLMPLAGYRQRTDSALKDVNAKIRYFSSDSDGSSSMQQVYSMNMGDDGDGVVLEHGSNAFSIRCKKNVENTALVTLGVENIHLNGGGKAILSILSSGEVIAIQNPIRLDTSTNLKTSTFKGWYTGDDFSGTPIVVGSVLETGSSLYAKFECNNQSYKWNGSDCVPEYTITFYSNGGSSVEAQKVLKGLTGTKPNDPIRDGYEFRYWHLNGSSTEFDFENTVITSNITLIAEWEPIVYNIDYLGNEGATFEIENPSSYTIESGDITLNNPTREGYVFEGWSGTLIDGLSGTVTILQGSTGDRIYEAIWGSIKYDLSFDSLGGSSVPTQKVIEGKTGTRPTDPTREGFTFLGWYWTGLVTPFDFTGTAITEDITIYAKWSIDSFIVTFDATSNGGRTLTGSVEVASGDSLELNKYRATSDDISYKFIGWSENPNSSIILQTNPVIISNKTLYAVFSKGLSATFYANGNKLNNANNDITTGCIVYNKEKQCNIITPIISNSTTTTVVGYTTSQEGVSSSNTGSNTQINISGGEEYYAQTMTPEKVLIGAVNGNNSTLSSDEDVSCTLAEVYNGGTQDTDCEVTMPTVTAHSNTPTFVGWNTLSSSTTNNDSFNISSNKLTLTETNKGNTWYAITTAPEVQLSVSYTKGTGVQAIGETLSGCNIKPTYNGVQQSSTCTVIAPTITVKAGYNNENKRWKKSGSEEVVSEGATITLAKGEADITYEASTNIITYTIEYEDEFGVTNPNPTEYTIESGDITLIDLEKEGYEFSGWYTEPGYINKVTGIAIQHGTTGDKKFYAKWEPILYTITYDALSHSGTINGQHTSGYDVAYNTVITLPTTGTTEIVSEKPGYVFIGWTEELGGTEPIEGEQTITRNVTYYPIFKKESVQYRALFSGNGATLNGTNATEVTVPCEISAVYNTGEQATTCKLTTPSIQRVGYEIKGYNENKEHKATCDIIGNEEIEIEGDKTYYAITKKDLTAIFDRNGNTSQTKYGTSTPTTDIIEETCSVWNEGTECKVRTPTITTDKTVIGYTTSAISSGENLIGENTELTLATTLPTIPVRYYAWTKSNPTEIEISYSYGTGVETRTETSGRCIPEVRYNGDETLTGCLIKLPVIEARIGYTAPKWYRGDTDVVVTTDADNKAMFYYTDGPLTLTAKATVGDKISYVVKHYFQTLENNTGTNKYQLNSSETDEGLSGEVETVLVLSGLKKQIEGFEYFKATVNGQPVGDVIDIGQEIEYAKTHQLTTPVEIKLLYTRNRYQYTLNAVANVTTQGSTESVNAFYGQEITLSGGVSNDCYERSGWQGLPNGVVNTQQTTFSMPASPVTITPEINEKTYTIEFDANAIDAQGTVSPINVSCTAEVQLDGSKVYTRNGYTFQNWNTRSDGAGTPYAKDATITTALTKTGGATVVLYAQWSASGYIVTFDANSGVVAETTKEVIYKQPYGILPTPTRTGYEFTGWYTEKVGGTKVTADTQVTAATNHTLYAQWEVKDYTVTFDANSGVVTQSTKEVTYDGTYGELPIPNRTGYTFEGWYTEKNGGTEVTVSTKVTTASNHILFAHWEENHYTIAFNENGGEGTMAPIENVPYSESTTLSENAFTRNGYHFIGWGETDSSTTVAYEDKATVKELTGVNNATVRLYALWEKGSYEIEYNLNGGALTGGKTNPTGYDVDTENITLNNPEREGYNFIGWSGTELTNLTTEVIIAQGSIGDRVYEANWEAKEYTIRYNLSGGALPVGQTNPTTYTIETASFTLNNPEREGYNFIGWSGTELTNLTTEVTIAQGTRGNRVYEANWQVKTYTVTWKNSTGTVLKEETLPYGSTPNYEGTPTSGADAQYTYTFTGWDPSIKTVTEDQVYTAVYDKTVRSYTIRWLNDKGQQIDTTEVEYGETPTHAGPEKAADAQYTYTFKGWEPTVKPVTGEATYTATYTETTNKYTITFVDEDGTELKALEEYEYGTASGDIVQPDEPTKTGDAQYSYTFAGWTPTLTRVTEDQVYTATYSQTVNSYPITFYDEDGTTIFQGPTQYPYGTLTGVIVPIGTPTKASDGTYTYEFDKWTPELKTVVGTADYRATYTGTYIDYLVTFLDSTGAVLTSGYYHSGETVTIPAGPAKAPTAQTGYTFKSWYPEVKVVTGDITYEPMYTETTRSYTIIWNNRDGTELHRDENQPYGTHLGYTGPVPTSGSTAQYTYTYNGWMPTVHNVIGPQVYTATYSQKTNSYPITWKKEDGTEIKTTQVLYGVTPSYTGPELTKEGYSFEKWTPDLDPVVGTASYTASYIINSYNITPIKGVGVANIIGGGSYPYNSTVTLTGIAKEGYHFEGGVSEKAFTYTVPSHDTTLQISAEPNKYYIHFNGNGGVGTMEDQEFTYDEEQSLTPNVYTYNGYYFMSWTDGNGGIYKDNSIVKNLATTGVVTLIAQWGDNPGPTPPGPTPTPTPSGGGSGGGGGGKRIDKDIEEHASAEVETGSDEVMEDKEEKNKSEIRTGTHNLPSKGGTTIKSTDDVQIPATRTQEEMDAYKYAYKYGITTLVPKEVARPDEYVQRGHMAKMVVNYALNVLHRKLPAKMPKQCKWKDGPNAWESKEIKDYAEKACALGLMGIDMEYFQPYKLVTRAQFGTVFGRLLRGKLNSKPYYVEHLARLRKWGIMIQIDRPEERIEIRKWAWLMFMRSEKYFKIDK